MEDSATYINYLTLVENTSDYSLTVYSTDFSDEGLHQVTLTAYLEDYPGKTYELEITVTINTCPIASFTPTNAAFSIDYSIGSGT
jgi:hypothetical protein